MTDEAFRSLYAQYRDPLFRFAYRLTGSGPVAEDIVHDCFVGVIRGGFKADRASVRTYLYATVRNLSRKHHRDNGREDSTDELGEVIDESRSPLVAMVSRETSEGVRLAVESLPLLQREVLVLFEYEELSLGEIARIVDAELDAVKSRLHRARERLRKALMPAMKGMTK